MRALVFALALLAPVIAPALAPVIASGADIPTAQEMVAATDKIRNPSQPFRVTSTLTEYVDGKPRDQSVVVVFAKEDAASGQFDNLVRFTQPARDEGKMVLFHGTKLWFYDPASKASVPISPQQRLIGQASDGDVLTVNWARDYAAKIVGDDKLQDADRKERDCWHLDMPATNDEAVYSRIELWLEKGSYNPVKGKFYSDSGRVLKIAYYRNYQQVLGGLRPLQTIIIDAVDAKLVTTVDNSDLRFTEIPDSWFQRDFLPRLKIEP